MSAPQDTYNALKRDQSDPELIKSLLTESITSVENVDRVDLPSGVTDKSYFAFDSGNRQSMPINRNLWDENILNRFDEFITGLQNRALEAFSPDEITKLLYTYSAFVFSSFDLYKPSNKVRGTLFELLICHLFMKMWNVVPQKYITISQFDGNSTTLPTDLVFDLGNGRAKYHVPCKTSTRERVIQVWAHQRVIDGVHGTNTVKGVPAIFAETKKASGSGEVIEICLPFQWQLYQRYIAQMTRIYYFDIPAAYDSLTRAQYPIQVKEIGHFFFECSDL